MRTHIYVDETKAKGYRVAAATGAHTQLPVPRKELQTLILPKQRALHMNAEQDARRRLIADTIVQLGELHGIQAVIYDAGRNGTEKERRERCLAALVDDAAAHSEATIIFDRDETLVSWDRQKMLDLTRAAGARTSITYEHRSRYNETLLAIPDAIAWSWARGGPWRERIKPIVLQVRTV